MALSMFGEFFHNVDAKGRLSVPSKFRDALGTTVVIAQGPERCLRLYSLEKWEAFVAGLEEQIDTSTVDGRQMFRKLTAKSSVCDIDSQGRIIVTPSLRDYAGITKEVADWKWWQGWRYGTRPDMMQNLVMKHLVMKSWQRRLPNIRYSCNGI